MPMRRQMQNKGELAVMVVCVVVGFLLAAQLRSVKLAGAADATNASRLEPLQNLYNEVVDQKDGLADQVKQLQGELELYREQAASGEAGSRALKAELEQRDKQIEEFTSKAGNAEELQAALDKAKADNEAYKADAEKREADMRRDFAIDTKLAQMGVRNAKAARAIIPNIADAKLDEQGNLTGIDFEALKKDNAYMFTDQPRESAGGDPKGGAGSDGLADFRAAFGLTDGSSKE